MRVFPAAVGKMQNQMFKLMSNCSVWQVFELEQNRNAKKGIIMKITIAQIIFVLLIAVWSVSSYAAATVRGR